MRGATGARAFRIPWCSTVIGAAALGGCRILFPPGYDCPVRYCPDRPECWEETYNSLRLGPDFRGRFDELTGSTATLHYESERVDGSGDGPAVADLGLTRVDEAWVFDDERGQADVPDQGWVILPSPPPLECRRQAELRLSFDLPPYDPIDVVAMDGAVEGFCLWGPENCLDIEGGLRYQR